MDGLYKLAHRIDCNFVLCCWHLNPITYEFTYIYSKTTKHALKILNKMLQNKNTLTNNT